MGRLVKRGTAGSGPDESATLATISEYLLRTLPQTMTRKITGDTPLLDSGALDSLGILHLMTFLSENLQIEIADEDFVPENFQTAGSLARLVERKRLERRPE